MCIWTRNEHAKNESIVVLFGQVREEKKRRVSYVIVSILLDAQSQLSICRSHWSVFVTPVNANQNQSEHFELKQIEHNA